MTKRETTIYEPIPEGVHSGALVKMADDQVEFLSSEGRQQTNDVIRWFFLAYDADGDAIYEVEQLSSQKISDHPNSKSGGWVKAILGLEKLPRDGFDDQDLMCVHLTLNVSHKESNNGYKNAKVNTVSRNTKKMPKKLQNAIEEWEEKALAGAAAAQAENDADAADLPF